MSVQFCKSGNVSAGTIRESDGMIINTFTSAGYTPVAAKTNSGMTKYITGFEANKEYYLEMIVSWSGFKTDVADNFNIMAQGSVYDGSSQVQTIGNPMAGGIGNFKSLVLSADSGSKLYRVKFTAARTGYELGCRADYSNGKGTIKYSNIRVIPADSFVNGSTSSGKILSDAIAMDNFIEN